MTLKITVTNITDIPKDSTLFVEGSEAGPLISKKSPLGFVITTSQRSILYLYIFANEDRTLLLGETTFSPNRFVRENKYNPKLYEKAEIIYETNLFDRDQKACAKIQLNVKYISDLHYLGQKIGIFESIPQKQPLKIATEGAFHNKNFCNCLDSDYKHLQFTAVEKPYRDNTQA